MRQKSIYLVDEPLEIKPTESTYVFFANFFDKKESAALEVLGHINFELDSFNKISKITETYRFSKGAGPKKIIRPLLTSWKLVLQNFFSTKSLARLFDKIYALVILIALLFALTFVISFVINVPLTVVNWIRVFVESDPYGSSEALRSRMSDFLPLLGILAVVSTAGSRWARERKGVVKVKRPNRDAEEVLASNLRDADRAIIYGGDFSYISSSDNLLDQLERLTISGGLSLVSGKSFEDVKNSNLSNSRAVDILVRANARGYFKGAANPHSSRFAVIEGGGSYQLVAKTLGGVYVCRYFAGSEDLLGLVGGLAEEACKTI